MNGYRLEERADPHALRQQFSTPRRNAGLKGFFEKSRAHESHHSFSRSFQGSRRSANASREIARGGQRVSASVRGHGQECGMEAPFDRTVPRVRDADPAAVFRGLCVRQKRDLKTITR